MSVESEEERGEVGCKPFSLRQNLSSHQSPHKVSSRGKSWVDTGQSSSVICWLDGENYREFAMSDCRVICLVSAGLLRCGQKEEERQTRLPPTVALLRTKVPAILCRCQHTASCTDLFSASASAGFAPKRAWWSWRRRMRWDSEQPAPIESPVCSTLLAVSAAMELRSSTHCAWKQYQMRQHREQRGKRGEVLRASERKGESSL